MIVQATQGCKSSGKAFAANDTDFDCYIWVRTYGYGYKVEVEVVKMSSVFLPLTCMNAFIVSQGRHPGRREQNSQSFPTRGIFGILFVLECWTNKSVLDSLVPSMVMGHRCLDSQPGKGNAGLLASSISGAPCFGFLQSQHDRCCFGLMGLFAWRNLDGLEECWRNL